jgi:hypothetical protein
MLRDLAVSLGEIKNYLAARRASPAEAAPFDPYRARRWLSSRETWLELREEAPDPASPRLEGWVIWLLQGRVNRASEVAEALAWEEPRLRVLLPVPEEISLREAVKRMILARSTELRGDAARAIERTDDEPAARSREVWARRGEVLRRLDNPWSHVCPVSAEDLRSHALAVLAATDDLARQTLRGRGTWVEALAFGVGQEGEVPWPRQLSARWLLEGFRGEAGWLDVPGLDLGPLPALAGGSSITRSLARLGARWADAAAPRDLPRALGSSPLGVERYEMGALLAGLARNADFLRRHFGLSQPEATRARRQQAEVGLVAWRLEAARSLLGLEAIGGDPRRLREAAEEHVGRALQASFPGHLALVLPRPRPTSPARLLGAASSQITADQLRDEQDEDWFRNPRAVHELRDRLSRAPSLTIDPKPLGAGIERLSRELMSCL